MSPPNWSWFGGTLPGFLQGSSNVLSIVVIDLQVVFFVFTGNGDLIFKIFTK